MREESQRGLNNVFESETLRLVKVEISRAAQKKRKEKKKRNNTTDGPRRVEKWKVKVARLCIQAEQDGTDLVHR